MEANELRIGNWIDTKDFHIDKFKGLYQYDPEWYEYVHMFEPIPLTEEWLLKFGFKNWGDKYTFGLKGINIHKRQRGFVLRKSVPIIKYVHQLQK